MYIQTTKKYKITITIIKTLFNKSVDITAGWSCVFYSLLDISFQTDLGSAKIIQIPPPLPPSTGTVCQHIFVV